MLRLVESVDILPDELCQFYLSASLPESVQFRPEIICVAKFKPWKTQIWKQQGKHVAALFISYSNIFLYSLHIRLFSHIAN